MHHISLNELLEFKERKEDEVSKQGVAYRGKVAQSEDTEQTRLTTSAVADDDQFSAWQGPVSG